MRSVPFVADEVEQARGHFLKRETTGTVPMVRCTSRPDLAAPGRAVVTASTACLGLRPPFGARGLIGAQARTSGHRSDGEQGVRRDGLNLI
jgi:hypothetical protein